MILGGILTCSCPNKYIKFKKQYKKYSLQNGSLIN